MGRAEQLITEHLDLWHSAVKAKSSAGRGSSKKLELYGITKLRELILDLAARGMLIPQENADERTSILLKQASDERSRLERDRTIKAVRIKPIEADEEPYKIPESWCWARFPQLCHYSPGKTPSTKNPSFWASGEDTSAIPWVSISDMLHSGSISSTNKKVSTLAKNKVFKREAVKAGSILMSFKLTVGKISRISVDAYHNEAIISVTPFTGILDEYIFKFLPVRAREGNTKSAIMGNTLNASSLAQLLIPLPPLAEQHRIVAKVDELMALCDQLEEEQENSLETHETLVSTLLNALTSAAADASQFAEAWQRIQDNFDILFTTESSVEHLKRTILEISMTGKLVPQNLEEEEGAELIQKIRSEREKLIKERKIKKPKPPINFNGLDGLQKVIPDSWAWIRLSDIADVVRGGSPRPAGDPRFYGGNIPFLKVADITNTSGKIVEGYNSTIKEAGLVKTRFINNRTVLLSNSGATLGIPAICTFPATFNDGIAAFVELSDFLYDEYLHLCLKNLSRWFLEVASRGQGQPNLNTDIIKATWIPLPPLSEQHRVVAKVDELLALCDQLKASLANAQETQLNLTDSIVEQAIHSPA